MGSEFQVNSAGAPPECSGAPAQIKSRKVDRQQVPSDEEILNQVISETAPASLDDTMKQEKNWTVPGFGPMTRVTTNFGQIPAQALRERDMVRTQSGDFLPIVWLDRILLNEDFMHAHPEAMPIELLPSAFGPGKPTQTVILSPGQDVCPEPGFGAPELTRVSDMLQRPGALRKPEQIYTYTVFHVGKPALVDCEGLWVYVDPKAQDLSA